MKLTERQEMSGRGVTSVKAGDQHCRMGIRIVGGIGLIVLNDSVAFKNQTKKYLHVWGYDDSQIIVEKKIRAARSLGGEWSL